MSIAAGPKYRRPPVVEVVCGVQFSGVDGWGTPHFGRFWHEIAEEYPDYEDQLPLTPFNLGPSQEPQFQLPTSLLPPLRRVFFVQPPGNYLIQIQEGRLLHNWRKIKPEDEYPSYKEAYPRFLSILHTFGNFLEKAKLPPAQLGAFELTYINHISGDGVKFPRDIWDYLAIYDTTPKAAEARDNSAVSMSFGWPLKAEMGSLSLNVKHGVRTEDEADVLLIELSARGKARESSNYMSEWFNVAHASIVETFDRFTTTRAHELWEKYR